MSTETLPTCSAFCTASAYRMKDFFSYLESQLCNPQLLKTSHAIYRQYGANNADIFYFSYGVIVCWGASSLELAFLLQEIKVFEHKPLSEPDSEEYCYLNGENAKILRNSIYLPTEDMLTKLAFSHGIAQSTKISIFEKIIIKRIENSRYAPESLAQKGRIPISRKKLSKMMGEIILDRNAINLHTDILDTPEFFWEQSHLEPLYRLISQDLDISSRVAVLNRRLDILKEFFEMLSNELANRHSSHLEWIIIILIFIEILLTLMQNVFHLF